MSDRRMFSKRITQTAKFLQMPPTSQLLYFHLGLNADDDGIVEAFPIMRMINSVEDDLRVLVAKGLVKILNQDLVVFICDWQENNYIRGDRKKDSIYKDLLVQLIDPKNSENISEFDMSDKCQANDSQMPAQDKLSKDKLSNNTICATSETEVALITKNEIATPTKYKFPCKPSKTNKKTEWVLSQEDLDWYQETYPNLDINTELRKAWKWLKDNNLKTYQGMSRYISGWLARANDKAPSKKYQEIKYEAQKTYVNINKPKSQQIVESFDKAKEYIKKMQNKGVIEDANSS